MWEFMRVQSDRWTILPFFDFNYDVNVITFKEDESIHILKLEFDLSLWGN